MVRTSVLMSVFNAMEYLPYSLKSIYDFADEIIIFDGLIEQFNKDENIKSDNGSSNDGTREFIEDYPDPSKKIKFTSRRWGIEKEKRQATVNAATGTWMMTVDSDEVYHQKDLEYIDKELDRNQKILSVWLTHYRFCSDFHHFYKWPGAVWQKMYRGAKLYGLREMLYDGNKVYKWPLSNCKNVTEEEFRAHTWKPADREAICYHYSNVCSSEKAERKKMISVGLGHKMGDWDKKTFGVGVTQQKFEEIRHLSKFEGEHPAVMKDHPYNTAPPDWLEVVKK